MAGEFDLITKYFKPLAGPEGLGLMDDASCVRGEQDTDLIITKDVLVEHVHFRGDDPADLVAHKALAVNVSDCAAKGGEPSLYWLGLCLPKGIDEDWVKHFSDGLKSAQQAFGCTLAGGDTSATTGPLVISLTLMGKTPHGQMISRSGAKPNDDVYVTGSLGEAALGLWCLENKIDGLNALISAYQKPVPPHKFGARLRSIANSSADISDGLIADVGHIATASNVGVRLYRDKLPLSPQTEQLLQKKPALWPSVWSGGDDYQIVFTSAKNQRARITAIAKETGTRVSKIGETTASNDVHLLDQNGEIVQVASRGYSHF